ncbi:MAG: potassium channel family protein [Coriobacteriales bacterium]
MFRLRMIGKIIRQAGLGHITLVFFAIFFLCALAVMMGQPSIGGYGDALWLCFQTVTTIGFGDVPAQGALCRAALVFLSIVSIFYLAVITGVVVAYCNQLISAQAKHSLAKLADQAEHLEELSPQQLRELSAEVRAYRDTHPER